MMGGKLVQLEGVIRIRNRFCPGSIGYSTRIKIDKTHTLGGWILCSFRDSLPNCLPDFLHDLREGAVRSDEDFRR